MMNNHTLTKYIYMIGVLGFCRIALVLQEKVIFKAHFCLYIINHLLNRFLAFTGRYVVLIIDNFGL